MLGLIQDDDANLGRAMKIKEGAAGKVIVALEFLGKSFAKPPRIVLS